jgi:hypothetical protein
MKDSPTEHFRQYFVGKLITDGICVVLHRRKNSVGKTVKCYSGFSPYSIYLFTSDRKLFYSLYFVKMKV